MRLQINTLDYWASVSFIPPPVIWLLYMIKQATCLQNPVIKRQVAWVPLLVGCFAHPVKTQQKSYRPLSSWGALIFLCTPDSFSHAYFYFFKLSFLDLRNHTHQVRTMYIRTKKSCEQSRLEVKFKTKTSLHILIYGRKNGEWIDLKVNIL